MTPPFDRMDDRLWDEVWERNLGHVERHHIALSVWRRRPPKDPFEVLVGYELAHRWRARARNLAVVYSVWSFVWALMTYGLLVRSQLEAVGLPLSLTLLGLLGVALSIAFRARMRPIIEGQTGFVVVTPFTAENAE